MTHLLHRPRRLLLLALLVTVAACGDEGPSGISGPAELTIAVATGLDVGVPDGSRLHLRAFNARGNLVSQSALALAAGSRDWSVTLANLPADEPLRITAVVRGPDGTILWSGEVDALVVAQGGGTGSLVLRAGGPENQGASGVTVTAPATLMVGDRVALAVTVSGAPASGVVLLSSNPSVLRLLPGGRVEGVAPGEATVWALAGLQLASATVQVTARVDRLEVTPADFTLETLGETLDLSVRGVGPDGSEVTELPGAVEWLVEGDAVSVDAAGRVTAVAAGQATVVARLAEHPSVRGEAQAAVRQAATSVEIVDGDGQSGVVGEPLAVPPRVRLTDASGAPVVGGTVTFTTETLGGRVLQASAVTGASGEATSGPWILGVSPGAQELVATAASGVSVTFQATAAASAPARLVALTPLLQDGTAGEEVAELPRVQAEDAFGNALAGVPVTFVVLDGGSVEGGAATTDEAGEAGPSAWTLGPLVGEQRLEARAPGVASVVFRVDAQPGAVAALIPVAGEGQTAEVASTLPVNPTVRVEDAGGAPVEGITVTFTVLSGGGSVTGGTVVSAADGTAEVGSWTLGETAGTQELQAEVAGVPVVVFSAEAVAAAAHTLVAVTALLQDGEVGEGVPVLPVVRVEDEYGNPVEAVDVTFSLLDGGTLTGGDATTDANGEATPASWTLAGTAGDQRLEAEVAGVGTVTFVVDAAPGPPADLVITTGDGQSAEVGTAVAVTPTVRLEDTFGNLLEGVTVTFSVAGGGGSITGGTPATVADGTASVGSWTLGAVAGENRLDAEVGALSVTFVATGVDPSGCAVLAVGAVLTTTMADASTLCLEGGVGGAEFTYIPVNPSDADLSLTVTGTGIQGVTGPPSPVAGFSLMDEALGGADHGYQEVRSVPGPGALPSGFAGAGSGLRLHDGGLQRAIVPGVPIVGDVWDLEVGALCASSEPARTGVVRSVGTHSIIVEDASNPPGGFTVAQYDSIAAEFDSIAYPTVTSNFGAVTDTDGNGRVVLFFTGSMNELSPPASSVVQYARYAPRDLFPATTCSGSNEGEILYLLVPDPTGAINSNVRTVSSVRGNVIRTAGRELTRLVNASRRLVTLGTLTLEEPWLDEALADIASELMFYRMSVGLTPRSNIHLSALTTGPNASRRVAAFNTYANQNYGQLRSWLQRPDTTGALQDEGVTLSARGAGWAFLRYAADRLGGSEADFWASFLSSPATGITNLEAAIGADAGDWLADFAAAMYADDAVAGVGAQYTQPSWNFRSVYGGLGGFPLGTRPLTDAVPLTLSYSRRGGTTFVRFGVADSGQGTITLESGGAPVAADHPVLVIRTR